MFIAEDSQGAKVGTLSGQSDQSFTVIKLPEGRDEFNAAFQPIFLRILQLPSGNVRFGDHNSYFIELPGGNNPYVYNYDDYTVFAEIWKNVILAEHGWPSIEVLEQMLLADAEYDKEHYGKPYSRQDLSDKNRALFDKMGRTIECQLKGRVIDKNPQEMFFVIADQFDAAPIQRTGSRHMVPYTKDGATWMHALVKLGLKQREMLAKKELGTERSDVELKIVSDFTKQLEHLQKEKAVTNYIEAHNGVDVLFDNCAERLFFAYDQDGLRGFNHILHRIQGYATNRMIYCEPVKTIDRGVIRDWFIEELIPLAEQNGLALTIESDRKYRFPAIGSSRRESFTMVNYYKVWSFLVKDRRRRR